MNSKKIPHIFSAFHLLQQQLGVLKVKVIIHLSDIHIYREFLLCAWMTWRLLILHKLFKNRFIRHIVVFEPMNSLSVLLLQEFLALFSSDLSDPLIWANRANLHWACWLWSEFLWFFIRATFYEVFSLAFNWGCSFELATFYFFPFWRA